MNDKTKLISYLIKLNIREIDPNAQIILYGSRARCDEREDSDWDILVLTDSPTDILKESVFRDHLYDLELETGEPFSIFVFSKTDRNTKQSATPYYFNVTKQGIQL